MLPSDGTVVATAARTAAGGFTFDGRISVRQGETRYHANVTWTHTSPEDDILLTNPLGQGIARLTRDGKGARLRTADRQEWQAADWEELSGRVFGHPLPLSGLPGWLRGESAGPGEGWRIDHVEYESGSRRPVLIEISREDLEVRLKIDAWEELK